RYPLVRSSDLCALTSVSRPLVSMRVYQFTEQPYFPAWTDHDGSLRVNLPNAKQNPKLAADLLHRYYDEWLVADELGLDIMVNEHHSTATCMSCTSIVALSGLARGNKRARPPVVRYPIRQPPRPPPSGHGPAA